jgi:hypothetical protein
MPPFQAQGTFFFQAGNAGWTEKYYLTGPDYTTCVTQMNSIATVRLAVTQLNVSIVNCTVSNIYVRGDSFPAPLATGPGTWPSSAEYCPLDYAILFKWTVGVFSRNKTFFRGFPLVEQTDGNYLPSSGYQTAMDAYVGGVLSECVFRSTVPNPTPPPATLVVFSPASQGLPNFQLARRKVGRPFFQPRGRLIAP